LNCFFDRYETFLRSRHRTFNEEQVVLCVNSYDLKILNSDLLVTHLSRHLLALEYFTRIRCSTVGTSMTMELGTVCHRSSALAVTLDRALEAFTFGNRRCIYMISCCKDISLDLLSKCIFLCVVKSELFYISLSGYACLIEVALLSLCHTISVCDLLLAAVVFCDDLFFLVNKANLNCAVAVVLDCLDLRYHARACLKDSYRNQDSVLFIEDLSHSNFCS